MHDRSAGGRECFLGGRRAKLPGGPRPSDGGDGHRLRGEPDAGAGFLAEGGDTEEAAAATPPELPAPENVDNFDFSSFDGPLLPQAVARTPTAAHSPARMTIRDRMP